MVYQCPSFSPSGPCLWSQLAPILCFSVVCYNELSVLGEWSGRGLEEEALSSPSLIAPGEKKPFCVLLLTSVSQWEISGDSPSLHPSACPCLPSSLTARWLCISAGYVTSLFFASQGYVLFEARRQHSQSQIAHRWLISLGVFKTPQMLSYLSPGPGVWFHFIISEMNWAGTVWTPTQLAHIQLVLIHYIWEEKALSLTEQNSPQCHAVVAYTAMGNINDSNTKLWQGMCRICLVLCVWGKTSSCTVVGPT